MHALFRVTVIMRALFRSFTNCKFVPSRGSITLANKRQKSLFCNFKVCRVYRPSYLEKLISGYALFSSVTCKVDANQEN